MLYASTVTIGKFKTKRNSAPFNEYNPRTITKLNLSNGQAEGNNMYMSLTKYQLLILLKFQRSSVTPNKIIAHSYQHS